MHRVTGFLAFWLTAYDALKVGFPVSDSNTYYGNVEQFHD